MKKSLLVLILPLLMSVYSCEIDNYEPPGETLKGRVVDAATGELVLTDQGSEGTRIRMRELSWEEAEPENLDFYCMKEGIFQNTKVFRGFYNVRADGAFIPLIRVNTSGDTLADESMNLQIEGLTEIEFRVQPFLKLEWVGQPTVEDGKVTATVKVSRAVSPEDFRAKIEPMGGYSDDFLNVTDVRLFVSQVPYVGYRDWDNRYSTIVEYAGDSFEALLGEPVTITTQGTIPPGRTVFIRAAARINYATENIRRHNYNEAIRVDIPR
ncbi:uncharacterized protein DUF3823 [Anseongella ginsenosidimutans]|uniref:Uncharacterized protein DUF3823 n=1 Tax=Anseongella ginsenosidimutans TaxID=496056 RepID=A0A4V2UTB1_9SPHI|nr:DUF3823 domain-containing protein [Anseongella ginsenosidimutans]QEC51892.1 DUF3823 domain-containing protein [Anseongella ginsenosidimutans]TCS85087.1 uncharacterized protein DUF3823 [Anseongella ginsenosidimutans]